ncbi:MAG: DNA mismatch repair endonuclease MutL [Flavobacteriaceae bacterium]
MSDIIQLLPDHVANQIAAGEVVQRPASVVKELLENAIDANATHIQLIVKDAGKTLIQVIDNGKGMSVTDARLSFERHATSKISSAEDLFQLNTKGFRGEALASIAAIAHVEMKTKRTDDDLGTIIKIEGSKVIEQEVVVTPTGTSIAVKNLFYNIPARRNFLKSNQVEMRHVIDEFQRVALVHADISFSLYHNGTDMFNLPVSNHRQRIVNIFGAKTNEKLVPVTEDTEIVSIKGFVIKPEFAKKSSKDQFFFVNDRFIKSPYLNHAVSSAFDGLLRDKANPGYFLFLQVDPKTIDINIHPTKTEIKFDNEHDLYAIIKSTVKHSLGQFQIAPILDFQRDSSMDTPYSYKGKTIASPTIEVDRTFNPFEPDQKEKTTSGNFSSKPYQKKTTDSWESLYVGLESKMTDNAIDVSTIEVESEEVTGSFFDSEEVVQEHVTLQVQNKYIVSKIKSGMVVIHQHRAHERILFEEFLQHITVHQAVSQQLLFPVVIDVTKEELAFLNDIQTVLEHTGFVFSKLENDAIEISGIPAAIKNEQVRFIISDLLACVDEHSADDVSFYATLVAKSMAKSIAIKSGKPLSKQEQEDIVNRLFACKEPTMTPSNKSIFITYNTNDFDKRLL